MSTMCASGSGGGATDIRSPTPFIYDRILVAGGGGGADGFCGGNGGNGGYPSGTSGTSLNLRGSCSSSDILAAGGSQSSGGAAAHSAYGSGIAGIFGQGGDGCSANSPGGGGGYYGGGGRNYYVSSATAFFFIFLFLSINFFPSFVKFFLLYINQAHVMAEVEVARVMPSLQRTLPPALIEEMGTLAFCTTPVPAPQHPLIAVQLDFLCPVLHPH